VRAAHIGAHPRLKKIRNRAMQYIRRRIQRVSGVTVRDERLESRDFSVQSSRQSSRESWNNDRVEGDRTSPQRDVCAAGRIGAAHRERT
jgi:hypothetical protein